MIGQEPFRALHIKAGNCELLTAHVIVGEGAAKNLEAWCSDGDLRILISFDWWITLDQKASRLVHSLVWCDSIAQLKDIVSCASRLAIYFLLST